MNMKLSISLFEAENALKEGSIVKIAYIKGQRYYLLNAERGTSVRDVVYEAQARGCFCG
jgi:hypothetical protein